MLTLRAALVSVSLLTMVTLASGCATSVSTQQTARTLAPGHVQVAVAGAVPVHTSAVAKVIDAASSLGDRFEQAEETGNAISERDQREAFETSLALLLFTPGVSTEFMGRIGVVDNVDVGLRYAGSLLKTDAKWQLLGKPGEPEVALNLGYAYHFGFAASALKSAYSLLDYTGLSDYSRHDLDAGVIASRSWGDWLELYFAGRTIVSFVGLDGDIEKVETTLGVDSTDLDSRIVYAGGTAGIMLGYKYLFLNAELTVMKVVFEPNIMGQATDLGGWLVSPLLGLNGRF